MTTHDTVALEDKLFSLFVSAIHDKNSNKFEVLSLELNTFINTSMTQAFHRSKRSLIKKNKKDVFYINTNHLMITNKWNTSIEIFFVNHIFTIRRFEIVVQNRYNMNV